MLPPIFHLLAGPNGAGKSTLYRALVKDEHICAELTFINADLYERDHLSHIVDSEERSKVAREWPRPSEKPSFWQVNRLSVKPFFLTNQSWP